MFVAALAATAPLAGQSPPGKRPPWTTSKITGAPEPPRPYVIERVFSALAFDQPVELVVIPGTNRLAVLELMGKIYSIADEPLAKSGQRELVADIAACDPRFFRLYGMTFHPKFTENRYCYVSYVLKDRLPGCSRVSRFKMAAGDPPRLDVASEEVLLTWQGQGHNGAHLQFGPDGYLYVSTGDGGDSFPPDGRNTGQNLMDLEASILRIDVDRAAEGRLYSIPADNPFVNVAAARGEVWAYGMRNPWKMCFDPTDGSLWVGDVGWELWEMIYRIERGGNYGWSIVEASQPVQEERERGPTPILPPTVAHNHVESRSITGGYFSQASRLRELRGAYIYGDYVTGKIWGLKHAGGKITWREELVDTPLQMATFGLDHAGDVLIVDHPSGAIYRLAPNPRRGANDTFPRKLSQTGLFASAAKHLPAAGVLPYKVNAEPWADGTTAERLVALPGESKLGVYKKTDNQIGYIAGEWQFPDGGVLAKTVSLAGRRLETQILHFDVDAWKAYNYIWNDEQTDAALAGDVPSESNYGAEGSKWRHASRTECILCHTTRVGTVHGFRLPMLGSEADRLDHLGLLADSLPRKRDNIPDPHDASQTLEARARAYLHVNCGHCHSRGGGGSSFFDVRWEIPTDKARLFLRPTQGAFGISGAEIVAPGDPYRSVVYYRMCKLGSGHMPQFGSQLIDQKGTRLIHEWIASLTPTGPVTSPPIDKSLDQLFASTSGALQLLTALDAGLVPSAKAEQAIARGAAHTDPAIRDLFERFVPEEKRVKRLGSAIQPAAILSLMGDASRGRELFVNTSGVQCKNCHRIGEAGKPLGPDLSQIGKKLDRPKLLESILEPSKTVEPQFVSYLVESNGQVLTGLIAQRDPNFVVLRQADGKEVRLATGEIDRLAPTAKSLMPDLLLQEMTSQQVADLLEFLSSLK